MEDNQLKLHLFIIHLLIIFEPYSLKQHYNSLKQKP
jgi:hypothetical protein